MNKFTVSRSVLIDAVNDKCMNYRCIASITIETALLYSNFIMY